MKLPNDMTVFMYGDGSDLYYHVSNVISMTDKVFHNMETIDTRCDLIISCYNDRIFTPLEIKMSKFGGINFHPSLLPKHRGWYPNVWSLMEGKAGITLHMLDTKIDYGDILAQRKVPVFKIDNAGDLYDRCKKEFFLLFCNTWNLLKTKGIQPRPMEPLTESYHKKEDVDVLDRARTFHNKVFYDGKSYTIRR